jgi:hypothetical protein
MPFSTFDELVAAIAGYLPHDALTTEAVDFITLAEARFNRELKCRQMTALQTPTAIPAGGVMSLPTGFLEIGAHQIATSPITVPTYLAPDAFMASGYNEAGGAPKVYTLIGTNIHFLPGPDSATYIYSLYYFKQLTALSASNQSNWLLALAPDLYLYASLLEAEAYFINDARMTTWSSMYDRGKDSLHALDVRSRHRPGGSTSTPTTSWI